MKYIDDDYKEKIYYKEHKNDNIWKEVINNDN